MSTQAKLTPRSQDEIVKRISDRKDEDPLGFEVNEYLEYLDFDHAKQFLKDNATAEQWDEATKSVMEPKERMIDYMKFAFEKAHGERGISANRSIQHMIAWAWLSGSDELAEDIDDEYRHHYVSYGLPLLRRICERLGIDPKDHGDS